jgi:hypothetical protein
MNDDISVLLLSRLEIPTKLASVGFVFVSSI